MDATLTWLTAMEYMCRKWTRYVHTSRSLPRSWLITGFVTRLTWRVPLVEQELLTLPEHMSFTPGSYLGSCYLIVSFHCMFCRLLFVLLYFFFWPLWCLFFDVQILITSLVSSNSSLDSPISLKKSKIPCFTIYHFSKVIKRLHMFPFETYH
jgi:hypothetical protein